MQFIYRRGGKGSCGLSLPCGCNANKEEEEGEEEEERKKAFLDYDLYFVCVASLFCLFCLHFSKSKADKKKNLSYLVEKSICFRFVRHMRRSGRRGQKTTTTKSEAKGGLFFHDII